MRMAYHSSIKAGAIERLARRRVARGIKRLEQEGIPWADTIDLMHLGMDDGHCCILGQLFHAYCDGMVKLFPEINDEPYARMDDVALVYGFTSDRYIGWTLLQVTWENAIIARRRGHVGTSLQSD